MADEAKKSLSELAEEEDEETTSENQDEDDKSSEEDEDKGTDADESSDEEDEDAEGDDDLDELEEDILKMEEEDLSDPANQAKVLEAYKKTKSILKQKKHWREKALKGADKEADKPPVPKKKPASKGSELEEIRRLTERNDFRFDHPEIPSKMVDEVQDYATAKGISLEEALQKPIVRKFVNDKDARARLAKASPSSKHRGPQTAKPIDWTKATPEQVAARTQEIYARGRG